MKAIISGGGTGGHIFPAIAIGNEIRKRYPDAEILFIGAKGKMEMEKVPSAGYKIIGLPIDGLYRQINWTNIKRNIVLPFKMIISLHKVKKILREFHPDIVIGVGGYASEPTLKMASKMGYPTLLQEQNSYAGLTNKMLSKKAQKICVAYENMDRFFPANKIVMTGNPVRWDIENNSSSKIESIKHFDLDENLPVVLSVGGSLGAESINKMLRNHIDYFKRNKVQLIWQTGKWMYDEINEAVQHTGAEQYIKVHQFISRMDMAYMAADIVISRAGALSISELCISGKASILIPSPNVAEDHQTKNADALSSKGAAILVPDNECNNKCITIMQELIDNNEKRKAMEEAIKKMAQREAAQRIVDEIAKIVEKKHQC